MHPVHVHPVGAQAPQTALERPDHPDPALAIKEFTKAIEQTKQGGSNIYRQRGEALGVQQAAYTVAYSDDARTLVSTGEDGYGGPW